MKDAYQECRFSEGGYIKFTRAMILREEKKNRKINFYSKRENFHFSDSNLFSSVGKPPKGIGNLLETQC